MMERQMGLLRDAGSGKRLIWVNREFGFIEKWEEKDRNYSIENFRWNTDSATNRLEIRGTNWLDRTRPYEGADLDRCVIVAHDPSVTDGDHPKIQPRLGVLRLDSGAITKLPVSCLDALGACFLSDRREVLVTHVGASLSVVKLDTGGVETVSTGGKAQFLAYPILSPDKRQVALLGRSDLAKGLLDFQMFLMNLSDYSLLPIGKSGRLGAPQSWLPDGSGIVLKRFLPAGRDDIEPRMLCVLGLDGGREDLLPGDDPLVLPKAKLLLF